jgi:DNA-binding CsgD family transcriptional regulator
MRLIALLKVNMDSKDIAGLLGISNDSLRVARYRLRKKLNLEQGDNLSTFIQAL